MSIEITIQATDGADLRRQLADLLGGPVQTFNPAPIGVTVGAGGSGAAGGGTTTPKRTRAPKGDGVALTTTEHPSGEPVAEDADVNESAPETDEPGADGQWDYQTQVKPAVLKVSQKHGRAGVEDLLKPFNVTNAQQIPAERYGELMAAIDKLLED